MTKKKSILILLIFWSTICCSQKNILFQKHHGLNTTKISSKISLSQNQVVLKSADTTLHIFNFYFSSDSLTVSNLNYKELVANHKEQAYLPNDVVITAVPIILKGDTLRYKKLNKTDIGASEVVSNQELLKIYFDKLYVHATSREFSMPSLKTLAYNLIIQDGDEYFMVAQPVLLVSHFVSADLWYFPNEFKSGVLNASHRFSKTYRMDDFERMNAESPYAFVWRQLFDRIYISEVENENLFGLRMFHYWELLNGDTESIYSETKDLKQYHPGLGSFSFIPKIGIVNCTLDYYLKGKILFDQQCELEAVSINGLTPNSFGKAFISKQPQLIRTEE